MPRWRRGYFRRNDPRRTQRWQSVGRWLEGLGPVGCPDCHATNHFPMGFLLGEVLSILGGGSQGGGGDISCETNQGGHKSSSLWGGGCEVYGQLDVLIAMQQTI